MKPLTRPLILPLLLACTGLWACDAKSSEAKARGDKAADKAAPGPDKIAEGTAKLAGEQSESLTPASDCEAQGALDAFFAAWNAKDIEATMKLTTLPSSGDGGKWVESEAELREKLTSELERHPLSGITISAADESTLSDKKKAWLGQVRAKFAGAQAFEVVATAPNGKGGELTMAALWFVDVGECKVIGLDD